MNAIDHRPILEAIANHINHINRMEGLDQNGSTWTVCDKGWGHDSPSYAISLLSPMDSPGCGSVITKNPHICIESNSSNTSNTKHLSICFSYGYDYNVYANNYKDDYPSTTINVGHHKPLDIITKEVYRRLFTPCWLYFRSTVEPAKESADIYHRQCLNTLNRIYKIVGAHRTPEFGNTSMTPKKWFSEHGYITECRAEDSGSNVGFFIHGVPLEKAEAFLKELYGGAADEGDASPQ